MGWIKNTLRILGTYFLIFLLIITVNTKILHIYFVPTGSMESTIPTNSLVIGTRIHCQDVERKDIVSFYYDKTILVKRVIGLPGDTVRITGNQVYVNNRKLKESYVKEPMHQKDVIFQVPENHIFVMGDNRNHSYDSRYIGTIPLENIISKGKILFFPKIRFL